MNITTFNNIKKPENEKQVKFIEALMAGGIELDDINVDQYVYNVYVGIPYMGVRKCQRFSDRDIRNCLNWFIQKYPTLINRGFKSI